MRHPLLLDMHYHSQNLNEDKFGRTGPMWKHGRAWWNFGVNANRPTVRLEWLILKGTGCGVSFSVDGVGGDDQMQFAVRIPYIFTFYLSFEFSWKWWPIKESHEFSLMCHNGSIWWKLGMDEWGNRRYPRTWKTKIMDGSFNPADFFLGRPKYSRIVLKEEDVQIPMYERSYSATVKIEESTWKRPRWFAHKHIFASIDLDREAPGVPGKGENSWDCGEDAIWGLSCPAETVHEAIGAYVAAVLRTRRRYGGKDWKPREKHSRVAVSEDAAGVGAAVPTEPEKTIPFVEKHL